MRPVIDYGRCCFCALCVDTCTTGSLQMSKEYIYRKRIPTIPPDAGEDWQGETVEPGYMKTETTDSWIFSGRRWNMSVPPTGERVYGSRPRLLPRICPPGSARCVECGVCTSSCPVQMHIPQYIRSIWEDDLEGALRQVYETNPLPGVCGRVCTHNCEKACAIAVRGEAIAIRWLKRYIIDSAPDDLYDKIFGEPVSEIIDARVAVVGSGPSSLSAAYYLRGLGYAVDVFEEKPLAGGVMRYGAPEYRLPDAAVDKDIDFIRKIGVRIHTSTKVGKDITLDELHAKYDAVFLGTGFFKARKLNIPGADHIDVIGAMDFLPQARDYARGLLKLEDMRLGTSAVVVGGGDVAFDVARNLIRLQILKYGKADVKLTSLESLDILPASADEYSEGMAEGIQFFLGNGPQEIVLKDGKVQGLRVWKCTSVFDAEGRFNPRFDANEETVLAGDQVYLSIGQAPDYDYIPDSLKPAIKIERGKIKTGPFGQVEGADWLFAGGDIMRGPDIITAVADGHRAAQGIDEFLYKAAKKKKADAEHEEIRRAIKFNTPDLAMKPLKK